MPTHLVSRNSQIRRTVEPVRLLRWNFLRGTNAITCEVAARSTNSYDVCVVPHWDVSSSVIETFDSAWSALERHAEISLQLREAGWVVSRNSDSVPSELAA
jgi:hypothetical protein